MIEFESLLVFGLRVTVVLGVAVLLQLVLCAASASLKHWLWTLAFAAVLALPVLSGMVRERVLPLPRTTAPERAYALLQVMEPGFHRAQFAAEVDTQRLRTTPEVPSRIPRWGVQIWVVGAGLGVLLLLSQMAILAAVARQGRPVENVHVQRWLREACARFSRTAQVRLRKTDRVSAPASFRLLHPTIFVPTDFDDWPPDCQRAALLHEMAHIARGDSLAHLLGRLALAICWFHPLAWWGAARQRRLRELACDERVVSAGEDPIEYGQQILAASRCAEGLHAGLPLVSSMGQPSELHGRIVALTGRRLRAAGWLSVTTVGAFLTFTAAAVAGMSSTLLPSKRVPLQRLLSGLRSEHLDQRLRALLGVAERGEQRAFLPTLERLTDPEPSVRTTAVAALGRMGCIPGFTSVVLALQDPEPMVRTMAAVRLGKARAELFRTPLQALFEQFHPAYRAPFLRCLGPPGPENAEAHLRRALQDPDRRVRAAASAALQARMGVDP